ncbi:UNVERIFIED_CONTAM: hypothetical protein FKN15_025317 [Acipenser sinensis]
MSAAAEVLPLEPPSSQGTAALPLPASCQNCPPAGTSRLLAPDDPSRQPSLQPWPVHHQELPHCVPCSTLGGLLPTPQHFQAAVTTNNSPPPKPMPALATSQKTDMKQQSATPSETKTAVEAVWRHSCEGLSPEQKDQLGALLAKFTTALPPSLKKPAAPMLSSIPLTLCGPRSDLVRHCNFPFPVQCWTLSDIIKKTYKTGL